MKRDRRGSKAYWDQWINHADRTIVWRRERDARPYDFVDDRPASMLALFTDHYQLMLRRYSRGDSVMELAAHFEGLLEAWEDAENLGRFVWSDKVQVIRRSWTANLDHYICCFWLTGLAITLNIPDDQWRRLVLLMGNEGQDALLDRVIAFRQPKRKIGEALCFPKAYQGLLDVVNAPMEQRPDKLRDYVEHWFANLKNAGTRDLRKPHWWYACAHEALGLGGHYFGFWCIEAVAVAKVFGIDDALCLDHASYPGDLWQDNRCPRYPDLESSVPPPLSKFQGWFSRLMGR